MNLSLLYKMKLFKHHACRPRMFDLLGYSLFVCFLQFISINQQGNGLWASRPFFLKKANKANSILIKEKTRREKRLIEFNWLMRRRVRGNGWELEWKHITIYRGFFSLRRESGQLNSTIPSTLLRKRVNETYWIAGIKINRYYNSTVVDQWIIKLP